MPSFWNKKIKWFECALSGNISIAEVRYLLCCFQSNCNVIETELKTVKEETTKQFQEAETVLELEKQKLLKVAYLPKPNNDQVQFFFNM